MTKSEQKALDRAAKMGRAALLREMAIIHRAGSARTQKEILSQVQEAHAMNEFEMVSGCLIYKQS